MDSAVSEMKVWNEIQVAEPARTSANERALRGAAQDNLIDYSDVVMCFVSMLNVKNMRAASHQVLLDNRWGLA